MTMGLFWWWLPTNDFTPPQTDPPATPKEHPFVGRARLPDSRHTAETIDGASSKSPGWGEGRQGELKRGNGGNRRRRTCEEKAGSEIFFFR